FLTHSCRPIYRLSNNSSSFAVILGLVRRETRERSSQPSGSPADGRFKSWVIRRSRIMAIGKIQIAAGLLAAVLTLGGGAAVVRAAAPGATPSATPGTTPKVAGCADVQAKLAQNLGIGVDKLQAAEKATANQLIDERLAAGKITPDQAQKA